MTSQNKNQTLGDLSLHCLILDDHYQYQKGNYANSLIFAPVSSADVEEIILSLRNKPGNINTFSTSVLKRIRRHVFPVLCHIINLSLRTGIFPDCLKLARVTPIPKGGDSTNYCWQLQTNIRR